MSINDQILFLHEFKTRCEDESEKGSIDIIIQTLNDIKHHNQMVHSDFCLVLMSKEDYKSFYQFKLFKQFVKNQN